MQHDSHNLVAMFLLTIACAAAPAAAAEKLVEPVEVRRLVADGKHNAFTALVRWKAAYWLAFRKAEDHNSSDGDLVVLRSSDAKEWTPAMTLDVLPDDRDPQFLATSERL